MKVQPLATIEAIEDGKYPARRNARGVGRPRFNMVSGCGAQIPCGG